MPVYAGSLPMPGDRRLRPYETSGETHDFIRQWLTQPERFSGGPTPSRGVPPVRQRYGALDRRVVAVQQISSHSRGI